MAIALSKLCLVAALGCSPGTPAPRPGAGATSPHRGGTLHVSFVDDVRGIDPARAYDEFSTTAEHLLFDTLVDYAPADASDPLALVPALAEDWSVSPDGKRYTFTIRQGASFSDGEPVVAGDFVRALDRVRAPETASPGAGFYAGIASLTARDDRHLEIALAAPEPSFPLKLAMPFATPLKEGKETLGTGPFVLEEWAHGERIVFARNPRYWNPALPHLDRIVVELMVSPNVAALKFAAGELDAVDRLSPDDYLRFARAPAWRPYILRPTLMQVFGEGMNVTRPPFDDVRVRRAMNYALSKEDSVVLANGRALVAHGVLPPGVPGYDPDLPAYPHDPARARALLAEAGIADGFAVTYTTIPDEIPQLLAQSIQADLAAVGVKMRISTLTFPAYLAAAGAGELELFFTAWTMDFPDASDFLDTMFQSSSDPAIRTTRYASPEVDALLDAARVELDGEKRRALYARAERIIHDDCPWIFHYHPVGAELRQPRLMGYRPHPVWLRDFRRAWLDD